MSRKIRQLAVLTSASLLLGTALNARSDSAYPYQQWVCHADASGQWHCQHRATTPGQYPQSPTIRSADSGPELQHIYSEWDWHSKDSLNNPQDCRPGCSGSYIAPEADWPDADTAPEQAALRAEAGESTLKDGIVQLSETVVISQGNRLIRANQASLDRSNNHLMLQGDIAFREPQLLIRAERASVDTQSGQGRFEQTRIVKHDAGQRITADLTERSGAQQLHMENARFTQCTPDNEVWALVAGDLTLDHASGLGTAKHSRIEVNQIPIFYAPYLSFPIDDRRISGVLWPSIGNSSGGGTELSLPYYFNLAENQDATLTPRHMGRRGDMAELEWRQLNAWGSWLLGGAYLDRDRLRQSKRWLSQIQQQAGSGLGWHSKIDYTRVSDEDYFKDLSLASLEARRAAHLEQSAYLSYQASDWQASLLALEYQTIDEDFRSPYEQRPSLLLEKYSRDQNFALNWEMLAGVSQFDHRNAIDQGGDKASGTRRYADLGASFPLRGAGAYITPSVMLRHIAYELDNSNGADESPDATVLQGALDMGLILERDSRWGDTRYRQTLEPRLYYLYRDFQQQDDFPIFDSRLMRFSYQQLFNDRRFSGHDRLGDAQQLSLGFSNRWVDPLGEEKLLVNIGQIFYFHDRRVTLPDSRSNPQLSHSDIATQLRYRHSPALWINQDLVWNSADDEINEAGLYLHFDSEPAQRAQAATLYNLGYRYQRPDRDNPREIEQLDLSATRALSPRWRVFARYQHDISARNALEEMIGVEYNDCCWLGRLIYQSSVSDDTVAPNGDIEVERDHTIILEFRLKGLGSLGTKAASLLQENILGYRDIE